MCSQTFTDARANACRHKSLMVGVFSHLNLIHTNGANLANHLAPGIPCDCVGSTENRGRLMHLSCIINMDVGHLAPHEYTANAIFLTMLYSFILEFTSVCPHRVRYFSGRKEKCKYPNCKVIGASRFISVTQNE